MNVTNGQHFTVFQLYHSYDEGQDWLKCVRVVRNFLSSYVLNKDGLSSRVAVCWPSDNKVLNQRRGAAEHHTLASPVRASRGDLIICYMLLIIYKYVAMSHQSILYSII